MGWMSAVFGVLVFSTWLIPVLSEASYVPVFLMGAMLVPVGTLGLFLLSGTIERARLHEK